MGPKAYPNEEKYRRVYGSSHMPCILWRRESPPEQKVPCQRTKLTFHVEERQGIETKYRDVREYAANMSLVEHYIVR